MSTPPRWDLSNVFPSLESKEFTAASASMKSQIEALETFFKEKISSPVPPPRSMNSAVLAGEASSASTPSPTLLVRCAPTSSPSSPPIRTTPWR